MDAAWPDSNLLFYKALADAVAGFTRISPSDRVGLWDSPHDFPAPN